MYTSASSSKNSVMVNIGLAIAYFFAGTIGLLLATPPGYATSVWPAAGIALGAVLLYGWRCLLGVVLGSLCINILITVRASGQGILDIGWIVPLLIALGAGAQAWAGQILIRRYVGPTLHLDDPEAILKVLALGGFLATLVNATWSITLLYSIQAIHADRIVQNWVTWWIGDSIGVLVFTPLVLVWGIPKPWFDRTRALMVTAVLVSAFGLTVLGFLLVVKLEAQDRVGRFQANGAQAVTQIERRFAEYEAFARDCHGLFNASTQVTRLEFHRFTHHWLERHPEVQAVEWAPIVRHQDRATMENAASLEIGGSPFEFISRPEQGQTHQRSPDRNDYAPLLYVEPLAANRIVLGYDVAGEPLRRQLLEMAAQEGEPVASAPLQLAQDTEHHPAIVIYTPVFRNPEQKSGQWQDLAGFIVMALKTDQVIGQMAPQFADDGLMLAVIDKATGKPIFGETPPIRQRNVAIQMGLHFQDQGIIGKRQWRFDVWPTETRLASYESWLTWTVLVTGLIGTSLAVSFSLINSGRRYYLERAVTSRTHELQERNAELEVARIEADQANASKGVFLANMSHEIRTPMNAILGMVHLLTQTELTPRQRDYASKTQSAAKSLLGILNDILDFSKVEAGKMELDLHPFRIDKLMRDLSVILSANTGDRNVEVLLDVDAELPVSVMGDSLRLQQVLINLAGNAIKFTQNGEVVVTLTLEKLGDNNVTIGFAVRDSGIGIPADQLGHIFEGFTQAEASTSRRFGGTGLGLGISKRLVALMGGDLQVESTLGVGSRFYFAISCPRIHDEPSLHDQYVASAIPLALTCAQPLKTLVVDDNASARTVLGHIIQSLGWQVDVVSSGQEALALLEHPENSGFPYDVVFMDWKMPDMDGWQTTCHIHQRYQGQKLPIIIMVTAQDRERLAQRMLTEAVALDGFLVKPVTASMLFDAVVDANAGAMGVAAKTFALPSSTRLAGLRLLVVEDNHMNQQIARELLGNEGAEVVVASNGRLGVEAALTTQPPFDVILMDIQMPDMDGYTATEQIRRHEHMKTVPIIAMTANAMASDKAACLAAGMNNHIGKPIDVTILVNTILHYCAPETNRSPQEITLAPTAVETPSSGKINIELALKRLGGKKKLLINLAERFIADTATTAADLQQQLRQGNYDDVAHKLHSLKGLAGTVGATELATLLADMESQLESLNSPAAIDSAINTLATELYASRAALATIAQQLRAAG